MTDIDTLARTIYGEARGEGYRGQQAVANVVMNRVAQPDHPHFGNGSISAACLAPWQFSCHNPNDPNCAVLAAVTEDDRVFAQCMDIAQDAIAGDLQDITNAATYYYAKGSPEPKWAFGKDPCAIIGNHIFFKDIA